MLIWYAYVFPLKTHLLRFSYNFFLGQPPRPSPRLALWLQPESANSAGDLGGSPGYPVAGAPFYPCCGRHAKFGSFVTPTTPLRPTDWSRCSTTRLQLKRAEALIVLVCL